MDTLLRLKLFIFTSIVFAVVLLVVPPCSSASSIGLFTCSDPGLYRVTSEYEGAVQNFLVTCGSDASVSADATNALTTTAVSTPATTDNSVSDAVTNTNNTEMSVASSQSLSSDTSEQDQRRFVLASIQSEMSDNTYAVLAPLPGIGSEGGATTLEEYIPAMFNLLIGLSATFAVLMIVIGGFQYMSTDALGKKENGKRRIQNAIYGLILVIGAWLILYTIDPNLLTLNLNVP